MKNKTKANFQNGRARKSSSEDESTWKDQRKNYRHKTNTGNDIIEIDSDDSDDAVRNINNNNEESSPDRHREYENEQIDHRDSSHSSSSSDVVIVSDDKQPFYDEIEELSRITSRG